MPLSGMSLSRIGGCMVRKLSLAIALALGVTPFAAYSLGLGIIKSKSGLNQRFQADIELLSVKKRGDW